MEEDTEFDLEKQPERRNTMPLFPQKTLEVTVERLEPEFMTIRNQISHSQFMPLEVVQETQIADAPANSINNNKAPEQLLLIQPHLPIQELNIMIECEICLTNMIDTNCNKTSDSTFVYDCGHRFCIECTKNHFRGLISTKQLKKIVCPQQGCGTKVSYQEVNYLFREEEGIIEKLAKFNQGDDFLARYCVRQECGGQMRAYDMNAKQLRCPDCGTSVCFQCREAWHGYCTSCESAFASRVGNQLGEPVIFCEICRTKIVKTVGCNHMTCSQCNYEFCYICRQEYYTCICGEALPFKKAWIRNLFVVVLLTILIGAIPMALILVAPLGCVTLIFFTFIAEEWDVEDSFDIDHLLNVDPINYICCVPSSILAFYGGCLLNICIIPALLCIGPFFFCYGFWMFCYSRYENISNARQKLQEKMHNYNENLI